LYGWRFEGLTRRDPILQVYKGLPNRSTSVTFIPQDETLDASRTLSIALGGPDGFYQQWDDVGGNGIQTSAAWSGPTTVLAGVHALLWERDSNELPTAFRSYETTNRTLVDPTATPTIDLSLADESIGQVTLAGSVTTPETTDRTNHVYVRFADGAVIRVVEDYPPPANFGYLAPILPNATVIVAASYGTSFFGAYSIVHQTVPATGQSGIALDIQTPVTQVVTTRRTITLPTIPGFSLRPGGDYNWRVETHGSSTSVDEVTGSAGHFDAFGADDERPLGRISGSGSYTISTGRVFTTAP
jgi:hypothetical protein